MTHYTAILPGLGGALLAAALAAHALGRGGRAGLLARAGLALVLAGWPVYAAAFLALDYSLAEAAGNTYDGMPLAYRLAASWSGPGGSLYLFAAMLAAAALALGGGRWPHWAAVLAALAAAALNGAFARAPEGVGGFGLNPILRSPWIYPHPLATFAGYALVLAAALSLAAAAASRSARAALSLGWALVTAGIALGGLWSYLTFGWGGYWAWDPVEVAELAVWLLAAAAVHALGPLSPLSRPLLLAAASSVFLALYVTRSGLSPLHSFGTAEAGGVLLLAAATALLAASLHQLYREAPRLSLAGLLAWARAPAGASLAVALASTAAMGFFVYASLYVPAVLSAAGVEARPPSMDAGVRFYHPVLYPLALAAMLFAPGYFLAHRLGARGLAWYLAAVSAAATIAGAAAAAGAFTPLPGAPTATNVKAAVGGVVAGACLAGLAASLAWLRGLPAARAAREAALRALHAGLALTLIGVLASGVYAYGEEYFRTYTLRPGEPVEIGPYKVTLESVEYTVQEGWVDLRGHLAGKSSTSLLAWMALGVLRDSVAPVVASALEAAGEGGGGLVDLVARLAAGERLGTAVLEGDARLEVLDAAAGGLLATANATLKLDMVNATVEVEARPSGGAVELTPVISAGEAVIQVNGAEAPPPGGHSYYRATLEGAVLDLGWAVLEPVEVEVYAVSWEEAGGGAYRLSGVTLLVLEGRLHWEGGTEPVPLNVSEGVYFLALAEAGELPVLAELLEWGGGPLLDGDALSLAAGLGPGTMAIPSRAPLGVEARLTLRVEGPGAPGTVECTVRFDANGEASGIHGLVLPTITLPLGLGDLYIHVTPTELEGYYGSYHDLIVYYVKHAMEELRPGEALALTALMAAGYRLGEVRGLDAQSAGVAVAQATLDLLLLARDFNPAQPPAAELGVTVMAKEIPGVALVWAGAAVTAASAAASAAALALAPRRGRL